MKHTEVYWGVFAEEGNIFPLTRRATREEAVGTFAYLAGAHTEEYIKRRGYTVRRVTVEWEE